VQALVQRRCEPAITAAEIDDARRRDRFDQRDEIPEWLLALGGEAVVLLGIPGLCLL